MGKGEKSRNFMEELRRDIGPVSKKNKERGKGETKTGYVGPITKEDRESESSFRPRFLGQGIKREER